MIWKQNVEERLSRVLFANKRHISYKKTHNDAFHATPDNGSIVAAYRDRATLKEEAILFHLYPLCRE